MSDKVCEHKEWIGQPCGYVPQFWLCTTCDLRMTAGEYEHFKMLTQQIAILRELVALQKARS